MADDATAAEISIEGGGEGVFERLADLEWLETNGLGGWASSTVSGAHSRRYHGLLVAATRPPAGRTVLVSKLDETLEHGGRRWELGSNRYPDAVHPQGHRHLRRFRRGLFPVFEYQAEAISWRRTVAAIQGENTTVVIYELLAAPGPVELELLPLFTRRDLHSLGPAGGFVEAADFEADTLVTVGVPAAPAVHIRVPGAHFEPRPDVYRRFRLEAERERGLDFEEDLWTPGVLRRRLEPGERLGVLISTTSPGRDGLALFEGERRRRLELLARLPEADVPTRRLLLAADQFIVRRGRDSTTEERTVIAGYHWFADWGRDTLIALPGLCLATRRSGDARRVLAAWAGAADRGMLPNRFPEHGEGPDYNTADAALWLFVATHEMRRHTGATGFVRERLLPVLREILAAHDAGTRYGIRVDDDGLLLAGEPGTQLTWMDAKVGDRVITPRHGKAVEINALWYNALRILGRVELELGEPREGRRLERRADAVRRRFGERFWNPRLECLYDVVDSGDANRTDDAVRPNQILALSLPWPLLPEERALAVMRIVRERLLTPVGLRTLSPDHPDYRGVYSGGVAERDGAYHQGTVWAWLLGPWVDALLRYGGGDGRRQARELVDRACEHLAEAGVGTVSEIFDGDPPHRPRGAIAQAWSVAELLRARLASHSEAES